jgi:transmembrane sensor
MKLEGAWNALQALREYRPQSARHPDRDALQDAVPSAPGLRRPRRVAAAMLAASLVLAGGVWFAARERWQAAAPPTYATTVDGYERVALADGSSLELNAASEVGVHFSPAERRVRLVRGEAHFTVAKDPARPFVVEAGNIAVRAVGTAFNVRLDERAVEVLVTEGRVAVAAPADERRPVPAAPAAQLAASERIVVAHSGGVAARPEVERVDPAALRAALAWQERRLVFVDTPLAEALAQFNRRNRVQLELADADLATLPIGGSFRAENVDAFVRLLVSGGEITVEQPDPARIVLRKAK